MKELAYKLTRVAGTLVATALMATPILGSAQDADSTVQPRLRVGADQTLAVPLYKSRVIKLDEPAARISVGSPDIADILILRATQLYVLGKDLGTTNVLLWDRNDFLIGTTASKISRSRAFGARYMVSFLAFSGALPLIAIVQANWGFDGLFRVLMVCAAIILVGSRVLLSKPSTGDAHDGALAGSSAAAVKQ